MPKATLSHWIAQGWVRARRQEEPPTRWIVGADAEELQRLRTLRQRPLDRELRQRWLARSRNRGPTVDSATSQSA